MWRAQDGGGGTAGPDLWSTAGLGRGSTSDHSQGPYSDRAGAGAGSEAPVDSRAPADTAESGLLVQRAGAGKAARLSSRRAPPSHDSDYATAAFRQ